jgi:transcriptional regulator with XRE-family HTH domain
MKDRLKQLRKTLGLTQGEFGEKIGMTDASISHMEAGRSAISKQNVRLICLTFGVREDWLEKGQGDMMDNEAALSEKERRLLALFRQLSPRARELLIDYAEKIVSDEKALRGEPPEEEKGEKSG